MKLLLIFVYSAIALFAQPKIEERKDFSRFFDSSGVHGTFVLYNMEEDKYLIFNPQRCDSQFLPASTFKIFNSLTAFETGAIKDENEIIKWDGIDRGRAEINKDLNMKEAIKYSAVWFYQVLARKVGEEKMKKFVTAARYGNEDIRGGIDKFWLEGNLRISSMQQIFFLKDLYNYNLPFSKRSIDIVKTITIREQTDKYTLHAKTGWGGKNFPAIGWYVGYVEKGGNVYFFAMNIDILKDKDAEARVSITDNILKYLKIKE